MLTEIEKQYIEKNHNLIYWVIKKYNLHPLEEWYDVFAIEMCECIKKYNPDRGSFSNFFLICARTRMLKIKRDLFLLKNKHQESEYLEELGGIENYEETLDIEEISDIIKQIETDPIKRVILLYRYSGFTQSEISKIINKSQFYISNYLKEKKEEITKKSVDR